MRQNKGTDAMLRLSVIFDLAYRAALGQCEITYGPSHNASLVPKPFVLYIAPEVGTAQAGMSPSK
jgi:hypothetical protein